MNARDALFEDLQTLSDDAEELGMADVALVLEFAMDVFLMESKQIDAPKAKLAAEAFEVRGASEGAQSGWSISSFPLAQLYQKAS